MVDWKEYLYSLGDLDRFELILR